MVKLGVMHLPLSLGSRQRATIRLMVVGAGLLWAQLSRQAANGRGGGGKSEISIKKCNNWKGDGRKRKAIMVAIMHMLCQRVEAFECGQPASS